MASLRRHPEAPHRWQVRYRDPTGRQRTKNFGRKSEAERYANIVEADKARGEWKDPEKGRVTFGDWWLRYLESQLHLRPATRARNETLGRTMVLGSLGGLQLRAMRPSSLRNWVSELQQRQYSAATISKAYQLVAAALNAAVDDGLILQSPARNISLPRKIQRPMRFLSTSEVADLCFAADPRFRALVQTAAYTGLRFGELAALRVEDIDFLRRKVRVVRTLTDVRGALEFSEPKSASSRRTVQLPSFLVDQLAAHLSSFGDRGGLVFSASQGGPLRRTNFRRRHWLPAVARSVGEPCRFHDLRHTHAALLIALGEHPKLIQMRLGHASIKTTLDTYGHLLDGLDEAAAERLDQAFEGTGVDKLWTATQA